MGTQNRWNVQQRLCVCHFYAMQFIEIGWSLVRVENTNLRIRVTQTTILNFLEIITARSKLSICIDAMVVFVKLRGMIDSITISLFVEKGNQSSNVFVWECRHWKWLHLGMMFLFQAGHHLKGVFTLLSS